MKTPSKADIIQLKLGRAAKTLREARSMLDNNFPDAAINRMYYACFYAVSALLFEKNISAKTHSGVKQKLGQIFINSGLLSKENGEFYGNLFRVRQYADYNDFAEVDPVMAKEYFVLAVNFVASVQNIIEL